MLPPSGQLWLRRPPAAHQLRREQVPRGLRAARIAGRTDGYAIVLPTLCGALCAARRHKQGWHSSRSTGRQRAHGRRQQQRRCVLPQPSGSALCGMGALSCAGGSAAACRAAPPCINRLDDFSCLPDQAAAARLAQHACCDRTQLATAQQDWQRCEHFGLTEASVPVAGRKQPVRLEMWPLWAACARAAMNAARPAAAAARTAPRA